MPTYTAPIQDFQFILNDLLNVAQYKDLGLKGFDQVTPELADAVFAEAQRFCEEVLLPINQSGDSVGCKFDNGNVTLPPGFADAYKTYVESGWPSFTATPEFGGQGLPEVMNMPITEMICGANLGFGLLPALSHGAYNALHLFGTDALKAKFLPKMISGHWSGIMCLTEPQAGTDLGLIRTRAEPSGDGKYKISGTKIFISCGEHDATENIIGLVLARLPDAPAGVKGISLFLVPKFLVNEDGSIGARNQVVCGSIEHKMGLHGSPTCVMNYDGAEGYLVGEPHKGLKAMFVMMNEARLYVGIQGLGLAAVAYQNALAYAKERPQGRALNGAKFPEKPADPITVHPDVRRMLLTMRSFVEGARALAIYAALQVDISKKHPDEKKRLEAEEFIQIATPIIKGYFTDMGSEVCNIGMQVLGGYGYIKEYGMEQYVRDARIAQIYEGANGIQALDLVGRKLPAHTGRYLRRFMHPAMEFTEKHRNNPDMAEFTKALYKGLDCIQKGSLWIAQKGLSNKDEAAGASYDYMTMFGIVMVGYMWAQMAEVALRKLKEPGADKEFLNTKLATARFYMQKVMPKCYGLLATLTTGVKYLDMPDVAA